MVLKNSKRKQVGQDQEMRTLGILLFTKTAKSPGFFLKFENFPS